MSLLIIIFLIIVFIGYVIDESSKENGKQKYNRGLTKRQEWYYNEYLTSEHWKKTRARALMRAGYKCEECGNNKNLNVHHNTYENIWHERDEDLEVLCQSCHHKRHFKSA